MDGLSELLELMYSARDRVTTAQASIYWWRDMHAVNEVSNQRGSSSLLRRTSPSPDSKSNPPKRFFEQTMRLWLKKPDCRRQETDLEGDDGHSIMASNNAGSWFYHPQQGLRVNNIPQGKKRPASDVLGQLDPSRLIPEVRIQSIEPASIIGRSAILVRALPSQRTGAELELIIDGEYGVLLSKREMVQDQIVHSSEVTSITFDQPIPDDLFAFPSTPTQ